MNNYQFKLVKLHHGDFIWTITKCCRQRLQDYYRRSRSLLTQLTTCCIANPGSFRAAWARVYRIGGSRALYLSQDNSASSPERRSTKSWPGGLRMATPVDTCAALSTN